MNIETVSEGELWEQIDENVKKQIFDEIAKIYKKYDLSLGQINAIVLDARRDFSERFSGIKVKSLDRPVFQVHTRG